MNDIGTVVGRYLQTLAVLSLVFMCAAWFWGRPRVDLTCVLLFWAGSHLAQHNPAARKWTIRVAGLLLVGLIVLTMVAATVGTEGFVVELGSRIENPSLSQVVAAASLLMLIVGIPFALLLTPQARHEFSESPNDGASKWAEVQKSVGPES